MCLYVLPAPPLTRQAFPLLSILFPSESPHTPWNISIRACIPWDSASADAAAPKRRRVQMGRTTCSPNNRRNLTSCLASSPTMGGGGARAIAREIPHCAPAPLYNTIRTGCKPNSHNAVTAGTFPCFGKGISPTHSLSLPNHRIAAVVRLRRTACLDIAGIVSTIIKFRKRVGTKTFSKFNI